MSVLIISLTLCSFLLCLASCGLCAKGRRRLGHALFAGGWVAALALLGANAWLAEAPPFGNMRHVLCFFPLVLLPSAWHLRRAAGLELTTFFAGASAVSLLGALCMPLHAAWRQMPALQSPWFAPHVTSYVLAYGLMAVSAVLACLSCAEGREEDRLHAADAVARLAFPFMTFGLWSGALWADAAWGRYWAWDIKEVWSLLTWCLYLIYFHLARRGADAFWRRLLLLSGFAAVLVTFLVVNFLPRLESLHSYAR